MEDEAALLAELRAISNQSAARRFTDDGDTNAASASADTGTRTESSNITPDLLTAAADDERQGYGIQSDIPSTFQGERGGAAQDAELLALLCGVSAKSSDRFANNNESTVATATTSVPPKSDNVPPNTTNARDELPPWKRGGVRAKEKPDEVALPQAAVAPPESTGFGIKSDTPSTFKGERGGAAEDAELLALLRGVSAKSSSASRFADDNDMNDAKEGEATATTSSVVEAPTRPEPETVAPAKKNDRNELPPWKRASRANVAKKQPDVEVVLAAPVADTPAPMPRESSTGFGIKSDTPSTFKGERGGAAEDAELLALLRGVSAKSSSASRFADDNDTNDSNKGEATATTSSVVESPTRPQPEIVAPQKMNDRNELPPWKRGSRVNEAKKQPDMEVVVAAPVADAPSPMPRESSTGLGIKSDTPSTFTGERGGAAEDAELLALLRGVSAKSSSASRFADDNAVNDSNKGEATATTSSVVEAPTRPEPETVAPAKKNDRNELPPWKRGSRANVAKKQPDVEVVVAAPVADTLAPMPRESTTGFGMKSDTPSTFKGERGGAAEDAELLALLRGVSAQSSSASRFADDNDMNEAKEGEATATTFSVVETSTLPEPESVAPAKKNDRNELPPWKRANAVKKQPDVKVVVAASAPAPEAPSPMPPESTGLGNKSCTPSTFKGERGGVAEDAELLALLRGVSANSSSASRFADVNDETNGATDDAATAPVPKSSAPTENSDRNKLPPWKRGARANVVKEQLDVQVVVAAPATTPPFLESPALVPPEKAGFGIKSDTPSTFKGDRGGAAEDAKLLALLRGVSNKSSSASRFADDNDTDENITSSTVTRSQSNAVVAPENSESANLPPWKRHGKATKQPDVELVFAAPQAAAPMPPESAGFGIKSDTPSTFQGERGGAAEDAELLALLRGVSTKSSSASRFAEEDGNPGSVATASTTITLVDSDPAAPPKKNKSAIMPPWKYRGKAAKQLDADVMVVASPVVASDAQERMPSESAGFGIKSDTPSTFQGERGGVAEDAELLALLRGVSTKSSSASRFSDGNDENGGGNGKRHEDDSIGHTASTAVRPKPALSPPTMPDESSGYSIKSEAGSTYQGERGGAAEDAELLALLRGVSSKSSGADRFAYDNVGNDTGNASNAAPCQATQAAVSPLRSARLPATSGSSGAPATSQDELTLTRDNLPEALTSKNWKERVKAFEVLVSLLLEKVKDNKASGTLIEGNTVLEGLDSLVPKFVEDSQAAALDKALQFAIMYAEHCQGAGFAENASAIVSSLLKKDSFSSRPATAKYAHSLSLKLMEVGINGASSLQSVIETVLAEGLSSRKPKVVQASAALIVDAMLEFGSANLPLASLKASLPKLLAHSNPKVRDSGVEIVAELCRVLGSKSAVQDVIDTMKKTQSSQLDSLLASQPEPTPIRTGLRSLGSASTSIDAVAALAAQSKELDAERFAARPAVDLLSALSKTGYESRLALPKWSEKVGGLNTVLECGGEKPYKLLQPSSSVNYGPLISDMKKLLSNTHFAVVGKAMEVLCMLAEGVGEKLFPYLRPLLTQLLQLSKDKKLTKGVAGCLDVFFGNILGFEHLLDDDDGLPESSNEKKQPNALARASAMDYLGRCVERNTSAGPRGSLKAVHAERAALLCVHKLDDSDASVRKAATGVLLKLKETDRPEAQVVVFRVIESLKSSNPRAYKSLASTDPPSNGPTSSDSPRRPGLATQRNANSERQIPEQAAKSQRLESREVEKVIPFPKPVAGPPSAEASTLDLGEAVAFVDTLCIAQWSAPEDDGGVLAGLSSSKWLRRQDAINTITNHIESGHIEAASSDVMKNTSSLLKVVKEHTRGFKETNVNIMKSILKLFIAMCEYHESTETAFAAWATQDGVVLAIQKISDKKLSSSCEELLTELCVVSSPSPCTVLEEVVTESKKARSPVAHEATLQWFQRFFVDFGAASIGSCLSSLIPFILEEMDESNPKVKKEAGALMAILFQQIGPKLQALSMSLAKKQETKISLEKCFGEIEFDPSSLASVWPKQSVVVASSAGAAGDAGPSALVLEIPKTDLYSLLPADILNKMNSKDGKAAWKQRKEALDEVEAALSSCNGLIEAGPQLKKLADLARAIRDRMSDTQMNLKPLAARTLGSLLSLVDTTSQAKLGKLAYPPLLAGALNDIKKPMRDACLEGLRAGTSKPSVDGGGINEEALEPLVAALVSEVNESSARSVGLPEVLLFLLSIMKDMPNLETASARGQSLAPQLAKVVVDSLTSSKSETRAAATSLLESAFENGVITAESTRKASERLNHASQRTVAPILAKLAKKTPDTTETQETQQNHPASDEPNRTSPAARKFRDSSLKSVGATTKTARIGTSSGNPKASATSNAARREDDLPASRHPLALRSTAARPSTSGSIIWPEYPEEPLGSSIFGNLKKSWSQLVPPKAVAALFPSSGIRKQDDAQPGCDLLLSALAADRGTGNSITIVQLDFVIKWLAFALCSRETTVGLQSVLTLAQELFLYLRDVKQELSDSIALEILPFVLEKASNAKGRFRDVFLDLVALVRTEELVPVKRFGSVVCVAVVERSAHAKARVMACHLCIECIDLLGLSACGKRGVLAAAKSLSEEKLPENRTAALDLMESILVRMSGDFSKLARICGPNLSEMAFQLLQERWQKRGTNSLSPARGPKPPQTTDTLTGRSSLYDELPALSLRPGGREPERLRGQQTVDEHMEVEVEAAKVFAFSRTAERLALPDVGMVDNITDNELGRFPETGNGTASSLRARLLKIREKSKVPAETIGEAVPVATIDIVVEDHQRVASQDIPSVESTAAPSTVRIFENEMENVRALIARNGPLAENDPDLLACIDTLKRFHAALSKQHNPVVGMTVEQLAMLRECITGQMDSAIEQVTRLIGFAFNCGYEDVNAMMSIPLLSVCLASLMALFRDSEMSARVSQDNLSLLIRETGTALLDPRLSTSSELDDATGSQMVRAINKLAVQAATGVSRHTSILALMSLQKQLSLETAWSLEDEAFSCRLSRVVSKLFTRVVKIEEGMSEPFNQARVDVEAIVCSMDDLLVACEKMETSASGVARESVESCRQMVDMLVQSIAKYHGSDFLLEQMGTLGIGGDSALALVVTPALVEKVVTYEPAQMEAIVEPEKTRRASKPPPAPIFTPGNGQSRDVATLVSALGSAAPGEARQVALEALRSYTATHGDEALNAHLNQISTPFRVFIETQLGDDNSPADKSAGDEDSRTMSDRLRSLRSRLEATELAVQTAVEEQPPRLPAGPPSVLGSSSLSQPQSHTPGRASNLALPSSKTSHLARPSPSKLAVPGNSSQSLRERLAQSQENRKTAASGTTTGAGRTIDSSMGRAAALRARLEAVKKTKSGDELSIL